MVRRLLSLLLILAAPAFAGPKPPDVPAYTAVTPQFSAGTTANSALNANTVVPYRGLTGIETSDESSWLNTTASIGDNVGGYILSTLEGGTGEAKFRTTCNISMIARDDPIRNYGQPGTSHLHEFYGAEQVNAWSTYASLRNSRKSMCAGGSLNNTAYWFPAFTKVMGDGKTYAVRARVATVYYRNDFNHNAAHAPFGLRYVSGANMDNNWSGMDAVLAAANAQAGTANRYSWGPFGKPHALFLCQSTSVSPGDATGNPQIYIKRPDGTDPWNGTCTAGKQIQVQLDFSMCWDGTNLWSSDGYSHVVPRFYDGVAANYTCPKNYYQIFTIALQLVYDTGGWADYSTWALSSDAGFQTMINASATPRTIGVGESFHADWMDGWDPSIRYTFENKCMGTENGRAHECGDSTISDTQKMFVGDTPPDGRRLHQILVQPDGTYVPTSTGNMWLAPTTTTGAHNHDVHG